MKLVDANVLLYAVNEADGKHEAARRWLDGALGGTETIGFAWPVVLAFVRLSTRMGLFPRPLPVSAALEIAGGWLAQPNAVVPSPTTRHFDLLAGLLTGLGAGGNLVSDAHLAALALEHNATVITYDSDFARFGGVRWQPPSD